MPPAPARPAISPAGLASALRLAVARLARRVRQEGTSAGDDLTASRLAALTTIEALGPITLGELAAIEQVQPPSMTRIVARLEEGGLVERQVDPNDRRIVRVRVTARRQAPPRADPHEARRVPRRNASRVSPKKSVSCSSARSRCSRSCRTTSNGKAPHVRVVDVPVAPDPQLPLLLLRAGCVVVRHVDADDRARAGSCSTSRTTAASPSAS